jgi:hypothetical protein
MPDNNLFKDDLLEGEKILWTGRPETSVIFTKKDWYMVPISLLFIGFIILWVWALISFTGLNIKLLMDPGILMLFVVGGYFMIYGWNFTFGRFARKKNIKKRTYYAVTNKRVLVLINTSKRIIQEKQLNKITTIDKNIRPDGIGSLVFGEPELNWIGKVSLRSEDIKIYRNSGLEFLQAQYGTDAPGFYDIKDAQKVYDLVEGLRKQ